MDIGPDQVDAHIEGVPKDEYQEKCKDIPRKGPQNIYNAGNDCRSQHQGHQTGIRQYVPQPAGDVVKAGYATSEFS